MVKNNFKVFCIGFLLIFNSVNLYALSTPKTSKFDKRITYTTYNADDVVLIKCKEGYVSIIEFEKDERILNIATGFSDGWEVMDKDNYLFIKPKSYVMKAEEQNMSDENGEKVEFYGSSVIQPNPTDWKTNLIVTTNKDKIYTFDLELGEANKINYKLAFNYITPKEQLDKAKAQKEIAEKQAKEKAEYQKEIERNTIPRNWNFVMHVNKDSQTIAPDFAYDDGVFTYLGFSSTKTIPSVFLYDEVNKESILNNHIKKDGKYDVIVIHKTAEKILLRSGNKLVGIVNKGYGQNPLDRTYSTNKDNIQREIIDNE